MRLRRTPKTQAAPPQLAAPLHAGDARRGLIPRAKAAMVRRAFVRALSAPAVAPLVAVAVVAVFAALAVGIVLGLALAAAQDGGEA